MANLAFLDTLSDPSIRVNIESYISAHPDALPIFKSLVSHLTSTSKRKQPDVSASVNIPIPASPPLLLLPALSFFVPQRKKLSLAVYPSGIMLVQQSYTSAAKPPDPASIVYSTDVASLQGYMHLSTPGRAVKSFLFVLIPDTTPGDPTKSDAIVFVIPDSASTFSGSSHPSGDPSDAIMKVFNSLHIPRLDDSTAFFADAHRGTKDGFLFFLPSGVMFGFKKPVWFAVQDSIDAISYSSITRNTFNLTITVVGMDPVEFSMIDQASFAEIDAYVKLWGLSDRSMAEEHRAKRALKQRGQDTSGGELIKAEQQWNDQVLTKDVHSAVDEDDDDEEDENFEVDEEDDDGGSPSEPSSDEEA
ncbi:hypothetical protein V1512DRAFT_259979 [Lipomyces arxii]|uniref:uncharacterized protein n=1 Tax=Lipomyces arxii TaxID=56418 RepID=UPI0034CD37E8